MQQIFEDGISRHCTAIRLSGVKDMSFMPFVDDLFPMISGLSFIGFSSHRPLEQHDDEDDLEDADMLEEDGDEWDNVVPATTTMASNVITAGEDASVFGDDDGEEINVDQFAELMNQELLGDEEDGDGDMEDIFGDAADANGGYEEPSHGLKPMSLNQFAGGALVDDDDDDRPLPAVDGWLSSDTPCEVHILEVQLVVTRYLSSISNGV